MTKKVILDCDPGYDDAVAMLLAAGHPDIEVLAVTTVAGNQTIEKVTTNALRIAALCGLECPVAAGSARPLVFGEVVPAPEIHGESGLDGTTLPEATRAPHELSAARLIVDILMREPAGTVTIVAIGPLTNIALAARLEPRIVLRVAEVVLMGGGTTIGNVRPMAEFNIENDPEAAHVVFEEAWPVVMVGLDLTYQARAYVAVLERARAIDTPAGRFLSDVLQAFAARYKRSAGFEAPPVHDPCAVAYVIDPSIVETETHPVHVECRGGLTRGMTVVDRRRSAPKDGHVRVAVRLDKVKFWNTLFAAVERLR